MEHDAHPTDLLSAYALDILEPAERAAVQAHLEGCPECRAELAALVEVTGLLSLAMPELAPPEELRPKLLDEIRRESRREFRREFRHRSETAVEAGQGSWWQRVLAMPVWRPAAAVLIVLLLISNLYFLFRLQQVESQTPAAEQTINLGPTDAAPDAGGIMLIRQGDPTGTLVVSGLRDLGPDQQYQLWLVKDEVRESGAVFSVAEDGFTSVPVSGADELTSYTRFGITIEPTGGSPGPTGDGVLRSSVPDAD